MDKKLVIKRGRDSRMVISPYGKKAVNIEVEVEHEGLWLVSPNKGVIIPCALIGDFIEALISTGKGMCKDAGT